VGGLLHITMNWCVGCKRPFPRCGRLMKPACSISSNHKSPALHFDRRFTMFKPPFVFDSAAYLIRANRTSPLGRSLPFRAYLKRLVFRVDSGCWGRGQHRQASSRLLLRPTTASIYAAAEPIVFAANLVISGLTVGRNLSEPFGEAPAENLH